MVQVKLGVAQIRFPQNERAAEPDVRRIPFRMHSRAACKYGPKTSGSFLPAAVIESREIPERSRFFESIFPNGIAEDRIGQNGMHGPPVNFSTVHREQPGDRDLDHPTII